MFNLHFFVDFEVLFCISLPCWGLLAAASENPMRWTTMINLRPILILKWSVLNMRVWTWRLPLHTQPPAEIKCLPLIFFSMDSLLADWHWTRQPVSRIGSLFSQRLFLSILMELWWVFKAQMVKNIFSFFCKWKWILQALDYKWPLEKSMKKSTTLRLVCSWYALIFVQASSFAWQRLFYFFCWSCCHGGSLLINLRISANLRVCLFFFFLQLLLFGSLTSEPTIGCSCLNGRVFHFDEGAALFFIVPAKHLF